MTKVFHPLTDDEISTRSFADMIVAYRALRDHHVAETEALAKRDRSAILRMAGNIAGGLCADPEWQGDPAETAVAIARKIVAEVDQ
jgi:hypothetical protein